MAQGYIILHVLCVLYISIQSALESSITGFSPISYRPITHNPMGNVDKQSPHREWEKESGGGGGLPADDTNAIREYLCLQAYLDTHQAYNDWCSHSANRPQTPSC